ncbi:MAG: tRNA-dihydrouridine synthase family protein [Putridiphycobacter sp.]|nr:tRNA-dihydrouridine synthase family protein [Putridiphycobacter sp.]
MNHFLLSSPLQGFTDYRFRNAQDKYFGGIDWFYAPYIRLNGKLDIKPVYQRDLLPSNNTVKKLIPQIMTNSAEEFLFVVDYVQSLGYDELNWNLGCPYPMVTKRGMGSGLICQPEKIDEILNIVHNETNITISMKMRMGYEHPGEIIDTFPILEKYPIKNIAIHARLGKQLYKGAVDLESFQNCVDSAKHTLYYNGDITSVHSFREMKSRFPSINHWMIGRGLITDPFLPQMIKEDTAFYPEDKQERFSNFHSTLFDEYASALSGKSHVLTKMTSFWEYWANLFENPHKTYKLVKKSKSIEVYEANVRLLLAEM